MIPGIEVQGGSGATSSSQEDGPDDFQEDHQADDELIRIEKLERGRMRRWLFIWAVSTVVSTMIVGFASLIAGRWDAFVKYYHLFALPERLAAIVIVAAGIHSYGAAGRTIMKALIGRG